MILDLEFECAPTRTHAALFVCVYIIYIHLYYIYIYPGGINVHEHVRTCVMVLLDVSDGKVWGGMGGVVNVHEHARRYVVRSSLVAFVDTLDATL